MQVLPAARRRPWMSPGPLRSQRWATSRPALETAIDLYNELGDVRHKATAMVPLGLIQAVSDPNGGEDLLVQAVNTFRELADQ